MKKKFYLCVVTLLFGMTYAAAQSDGNSSKFEGESTSKVHSVTKMKSQVLTKNVLAKVILKSVMKKYIDNSPVNYTGTYNITSIAKGNKTKVITEYNNSVVITTIDGDEQKMITYYPYVNKGYYQTVSLADAKKKAGEMQQGKAEKTGETIEILGRKCEVYKMIHQVTTDTLDTKSTTTMHNYFAVCDDPSLPAIDQEAFPGVKGTPLKFTNNTASQISNNMLNVDFTMSLATLVTSITPRPVDDSEFEVPSNIKLYDQIKDAKQVLKITEENIAYMKKNGLWKEESSEESKIYDNLNQEWDY